MQLVQLSACPCVAISIRWCASALFALGDAFAGKLEDAIQKHLDTKQSNERYTKQKQTTKEPSLEECKTHMRSLLEDAAASGKLFEALYDADKETFQSTALDTSIEKSKDQMRALLENAVQQNTLGIALKEAQEGSAKVQQ